MSWAFILSVVVSLAWIPVLWFFFKNWRARKNPISLSICAVVLFVIYTNVVLWLCRFTKSETPFYIMHVAELLTVSFFYVCLRWAKWKYQGALGPETRRKG